MFANGQTVIQLMEQLAPKHLALADDKIGLQLGSLQKEIKVALVALDVTDAVVEEAIRENADLIIAHHPIIYRPLSHLQTDVPAGKLYEKLIKRDIAVYVAHTNLDVADGGVNDMMAAAIGLEKLAPLEPLLSEKLKKLVVFVPESHHAQLLNALFEAGAGWIGQYSHCSFNVTGTGTFLPGEGTNPHIGKQGRLEHVREIRVETIVPESAERRVVQAMLQAHPYEEVAYDVYPLDLQGKTYGLGRVGSLPQPVRLTDFAEQLKRRLDVPYVRLVGDPEREVQTVAVLGGSGRSYMRRAISAKADVFVTGDIDHHTAHDALAAGLAIADVGHHAEKIMKRGVAEALQNKLKALHYSTRVVPSAIDTDPFRLV